VQYDASMNQGHTRSRLSYIHICE